MTTALTPLAKVDPIEVINKWLSDDNIKLKDLAEQYKVSKQSLSMFLLKKAETEWKDAQVARALLRKDDAEQQLDCAADMTDIARARERLKAAQWDLERVCRRIYGQDAPPAGANAVQININLRGVSATKQDDESNTATIEHDHNPTHSAK